MSPSALRYLMYYSVFENSIIMEDFFFKEAGLMCVSTGDACWQLSVCAFPWSTHIKMLTCIINLQACVCELV